VDDPALEAELLRDPLFDPDGGLTIAAPAGRGRGEWAGAPGAVAAEGVVHLSYRLRAPPPLRGHTVVISRSEDGVRFERVWQMSRDAIAALSIERCAIVRTPDRWCLLVSFVAEADRRWRIEAIEADEIERLDPRSRRPALLPEAIGVAGVKDPWVRRVGDAWQLFASFGPLPAGAGSDLHVTGDALSTGRTGSLTGLGTSRDLVEWEWRGAVLGPTPGCWDDHTARLTTAIRVGDEWVGLYDGSRVEGNYEERCGVAVSSDLVEWRKVSVDGPAIGTASGAGGVRYAELVEMPDGSVRAYYEFTREDGSHDLRTALSRNLL